MSAIVDRCYMILLGLCLVPGCRSLDSKASSVTLPQPSQIDVITVTPSFGDDRPTWKIVEDENIAQFVQFINNHKDGWRQPWDTFPVGQYTVGVKSNGKTIAVFWLSPGFVGGRTGDEGAAQNRLVNLTEDDWQELAKILGITDHENHEQ